MTYGIWTSISGLENAKNRFLVIWYPQFTVCFHDLSVFSRIYSLHIMWSLHTLFMAFCCCKSPKTLVQIQAVGHERKKWVLKNKDSLNFWGRDCPRLWGLSQFMQTILVYRPAPLHLLIFIIILQHLNLQMQYLPYNYNVSKIPSTYKFSMLSAVYGFKRLEILGGRLMAFTFFHSLHGHGPPAGMAAVYYLLPCMIAVKIIIINQCSNPLTVLPLSKKFPFLSEI